MVQKYSVNVENDKIVSVEVDGVVYEDPDQIPDPEERAKALLLMSEFPGAIEQEVPTGSGMSLEKILLTVFLSVAILMLGIASFAGRRAMQSLSREVKAAGQVVDIVARRGQSGTFYYPVVEITLANGSKQRVPISEGSWPPAYQEGEHVIIAYDPNRPNSVRISTFSSTLGQFTLSIITSVLGVAFLGAAFFARWMMDQAPPEPMAEMTKKDREWLVK
jgi:hypothetical protein